MTFPSGISDLTASWQPGKRLFRSWILLAQILPIEYDDVAFEEVDSGRRYLERSSMLSQRVWEHERRIDPSAEGSRVTDRIRFAPRVSWLAGAYRPIFKVVFQWRHRNLRKLFGEAAA